MRGLKLSIIGLTLLFGLANGVELSMESADDGKTVHQEKSRMVVMDFGALDTIHALGGADRVIGLPQGSRPEYLEEFADETRYFNTGGMKTPDVEIIQEHHPDLIILSPRQQKSMEALSPIADTYLYQIDNEHYKLSVKKHILFLGSLINRPDEAKIAWDRLVTRMKANEAIIAESNLSALVILHNDGKLWASNTNGFATFIHQVMGVNRADAIMDERSAEVTDRYLQMQDPDIIYIVDRSEAIGAKGINMDYFKRPALRSVSAIKDNRVIYLTPKLWYLSGNGLESIQLQMDEVMQPFQSQQ